MAAPWDYASKVYLDLKATLDDGTLVTLKIDRYLNNGLKLQRNTDAGKARDNLLSAIADELKVKYPPPLTFTIDNIAYDRLKLQHVFTGKGAPEDIRNVLRLASRRKLTDVNKVDKYCSTNIGLDCNGFTCHFWGTATDLTIDGYDVDRRTAAADIAAGDAMIFYHTGVSAAAHIAVVDEVNIIGKQIQVFVAQSAGLEKGLERFDWGRMTPQNNKKGELFVQQTIGGFGDATIFFAKGPPKGKSDM